MNYAIEYLVSALKKARERKKISQRALGRRVGMPQAQISKIENAKVDLKTSSLIALARSLDLEVMLIPRKLVPGVQSFLAVSKQAENGLPAQRPAYTLDDEESDG